MAFLQHEKLFSRKWFATYSLITLGAFILAAGFVFFITPYKIVPGGVYGIAIVVHHLTKGIFSFFPNGLPVGAVGLVLNIPLTIIGIRILGPRFGVKTVVGFVLTSAFIDLITWYWGDAPLVTDDALLSSIFGGVLIGLGLGLVFKSKATSGGSDIIAMILAKHTRLPLGQLMIYVDSVIVLVGLIAFGDWRIPLYSWIVIFITGKVIDVVIEGISYDKTLFIISEKHQEIRTKILADLNRGGTLIEGKGMYNYDDRKIIFTVVNRRELAILEDYIHTVDPNAFLAVINANEILGQGFKSLEEKVSE
ncbi:MAG TPA: YitT family protein [Bacteroidales bacterium]|nr:YitT family protein [Bacteroidales bacterium]HNS45885.1 YitT family protein [Bacteroidales bacterium]